jgi:hypothetical protein
MGAGSNGPGGYHIGEHGTVHFGEMYNEWLRNEERMHREQPPQVGNRGGIRRRKLES